MESMVNTYNPKAMAMEEEEGVKIKRIKKHDDDSFEEKEEASCMVVDWISELPEFIIHHILSFLESPREVTKTSVLSKRWYHHIWALFPVLNFLEDRFCQGSASTTTIYGKDLQELRLKFISARILMFSPFNVHCRFLVSLMHPRKRIVAYSLLEQLQHSNLLEKLFHGAEEAALSTAALKLVGETFTWSRGSRFMYTMENHNSVLGIRICTK